MKLLLELVGAALYGALFGSTIGLVLLAVTGAQ